MYVKHLIYRTVSLKWESVPWVRVLHLLRTILWQPKCASYVRHVSFLPENSSKWKPNREKSDLKDVLCQAEAFVKEAEFPYTSMWVRALHDEDLFACVAVLSLRLNWSFVRRSGFPGLMFYRALSSALSGMPSAFGSLTVVDYGSNVPTVLENNDEAYPSAWMRCNEYQFTAWFCLLILPFCDILSNFPNLKSAEIPALLLCWDRWPTDSVDMATALPSTPQNLCLRLDCEEGRSAKAYEQMIITFVTDNVRRLRSHAPDLNRICL